ncbi:MAG TPA: hypothetical protein VKH83_12110 [Methylomirabilota bacterium]|nr:hypothetical protein [Methylomirabilota bacterium]
MSEAPVNTLRPVGLTLTGPSREERERATARHEDGLRLLLLFPVSSLLLAAALAIALSLITGSPQPAPGSNSSGRTLEIWTGSPVIEEEPGDETTRRPR